MDLGPEFVFFVGMLAFVGAGVVVASYRPGNLVGWTLLSIGVAWEVFGLAGHYRIAALATGTDLPAGEWAASAWAAWAWDILWLPGIALVPLLFLLFPSGRLLSPRWRGAGAGLAGSFVLTFAAVGLRPGPLTSTPSQRNPAGLEILEPVTASLEGIGNLGLVLSTVVAAAAPILRFRRAQALERYQLKWFAYAATVVLIGFLAANAVEAAGVTWIDAGNVRLAPLVLLPIATAVAVLQYRLFDIDVVINKSILYAGMLAFIGAVYVVVVVVVGQMTVQSGDEPGDVNTALTLAATALAAVTFQPARERLQRLANRLVYGVRADPYDVLTSFTARMTTTQPAADVPLEMAHAVGQGIGAAFSEVWLRVGTELRLAAHWPQAPVEPAHPLPATVPTPTDDDGLALPSADRTYPVRRGDRLLGALAVAKPAGERISRTEDRLLSDLAATAWLVLENVQLIAELRASRQRLVTAQDAERRQVERDLHDGAQQRMLELALTLRMAHADVLHGRATEAAATIDTATAQLHAALEELRELARGVHPEILTQRGLSAALESLAERASLPVTVIADRDVRFPSPVEATAYFVAAEALTNVIKHAQATFVVITTVVGDGRLRLEVVDDGVGGAIPTNRGLAGLLDRVAALDGELDVHSPPGRGTRVIMELPCG